VDIHRPHQTSPTSLKQQPHPHLDISCVQVSLHHSYVLFPPSRSSLTGYNKEEARRGIETREEDEEEEEYDQVICLTGIGRASVE